jgi:hypothetical protein
MQSQFTNDDRGGVSASPLVGIQIAPTDLLDSGIDACLDFLQETAGINAIFCYSQTYHLGESPANVLATDHPHPPRPAAGRSLPYLWVRLPHAAFEDLCIRHAPSDARHEYYDRDVFAEAIDRCAKRGVRVYARFLEAGMSRAERIPGYTSVAARHADGSASRGPCWNHPDYREWLVRTVREMLRAYPLAGVQYGAERVGSLSEVLFRGWPASCFCEHCRKRCCDAGIDVSRVIAGFDELSRACSDRNGQGVMIAVLSIIFRFPELLSFYRLWLQADVEIHAMLYHAGKAVRPDAEIGQHVDHQRSSWDPLFRAAMPYSEMATHNDFIKPIVYHDILGPRLREWVIDPMHRLVLGDLSHAQALDLFYAMFGHEAAREPSYTQLDSKGLSPEYVYRETRRCVDEVAGRTRVYAGIGLDVPHYVAGGMKRVESAPDGVFDATRRAMDAGAAGVIASRELREISRRSLRAFGQAAGSRTGMDSR